ncbi:MAG: prenyltransferase [Muribaculaceae bacterium]|nr:prenyltransferase [Muribaculaceae bacterium]
MLKKFVFWLNCARVYSLPITVLNWLVIFIYSLKQGGNCILGILALVGISFVHMATNLADDYFDYKNENYMATSQNCKCAYLKNKSVTVEELKQTIIIFLGIAAIIGVILFFTSGRLVAPLAFIALVIALTYQKFSINGLGEIAIILAYGPLMYEGVFYVMTGKFSAVAVLLSLGCALITNTILYTHMLMDFDGDYSAGKKTLCTLLKSKDSALILLGGFYITGYLFIILFGLISRNQWFLLTLLAIPLIFDLYASMKKYNSDKTSMPKIYPWHYPLDNWKSIANTKDAPFYFRFFYSRNILIIFMLLCCIAIIIG